MGKIRNTLTGYAACIVTGGSSGIGLSFLITASKLRQDLPLCNLSRTTPPDRPGMNWNLRHITCDLSLGPSIEAAVPQVISFLKEVGPGPVLLVNNSGFGSYGPFPQPRLEHHLEMIRVNLLGLVHLTGALLPELVKRGGAVVSIASTAAFQPTPWMATYGATKAFLLNWSQALSRDYADSGLQFLCVCPGPTATNFFRRAGFETPPLAGRGMAAEQVVAESLAALAGGRTLVITGWRNKILAWLSRSLPITWQARIAGWILRRVRPAPPPR